MVLKEFTVLLCAQGISLQVVSTSSTHTPEGSTKSEFILSVHLLLSSTYMPLSLAICYNSTSKPYDMI